MQTWLAMSRGKLSVKRFMSLVASSILSLDRPLSRVAIGIALALVIPGCGFQLSNYDLSSLPAGLSIRIESNASGKEFREVLEREIRSSGTRLVSELKSDFIIEISDLFLLRRDGARDRRGLLIEQVLLCDLKYRLLSGSGDELIPEKSIYMDRALPIVNSNLIASYSVEREMTKEIYTLISQQILMSAEIALRKIDKLTDASKA